MKALKKIREQVEKGGQNQGIFMKYYWSEQNFQLFSLVHSYYILIMSVYCMVYHVHLAGPHPGIYACLYLTSSSTLSHCKKLEKTLVLGS